MPTELGQGHLDPSAARAGAFLTIDLAAIAANYRQLAGLLSPGCRCGAVVKADAYGLGIEQVAPALARAGAADFFVAHVDEAIKLGRCLERNRQAGRVHVLNGLMAGAEDDYLDHGLVPVLNSLGEIERWSACAGRAGSALPAVLQVDSGMTRLGLSDSEAATLAAEPDRLAGLTPRLLMTHLACAEEPDSPLNQAQLEAFNGYRAHWPGLAASIANSSGIFLGPEFHLDLARPGAALYGVNPTPASPNPMAQVIRLQGKILQVRDVDAPRSVGYGATHCVEGRTRIATVAAGYADGYLRSLSNRGTALLGGQRVAVVGRVSMDLITLDVSALPRDVAVPGALVDLIGPGHGIDALAEEAGTIGYELLTALGNRYHRTYVES